MTLSSMRALGLTSALLLLIGCGQDKTGPEAAKNDLSSAGQAVIAERFTLPVSGSIAGSVVHQGNAPKPQKLMVVKDVDVCSRLDHFDDRLEVGQDNGIRNAVVWLAQVRDGMPLAAMGKEFAIDQRDCRYSPHVLLAPVNTPVQFLNNDGILHNIHTFGRRNRPVNRAQPKHQKILEMTFKRPERVPVKCDVHGWMSAWIIVVDHPYYAITDENGSFNLSNIPPGTYTIRVWQELLGEQSLETVVVDGETAEVEVVYTQ